MLSCFSLTKPKLSASLSLFRFFPPHAASPSHSHARRLTHRLTISSHRLTITPHTSSQSRRLSLFLSSSGFPSSAASPSHSHPLSLTHRLTISHSQTQSHDLNLNLTLSDSNSLSPPPSLSRTYPRRLMVSRLLSLSLFTAHGLPSFKPFFKKSSISQSVSLFTAHGCSLSLSL